MNINDLKVFVAILCFYIIIWYLYSLIIKGVFGVQLMDTTKLIELPKWSKCYGLPTSTNPAFDDCNSCDIDGWSIAHFVVYFTLGAIVPGHYSMALLVSILCEVYEYAMGWRTRWWQDPVVNMIGYVVGSMMSRYFNKPREIMYKHFTTNTMFLTTICISTITLMLNSPYLQLRQ